MSSTSTPRHEWIRDAEVNMELMELCCDSFDGYVAASECGISCFDWQDDCGEQLTNELNKLAGREVMTGKSVCTSVLVSIHRDPLIETLEDWGEDHLPVYTEVVVDEGYSGPSSIWMAVASEDGQLTLHIRGVVSDSFAEKVQRYITYKCPYVSEY